MCFASLVAAVTAIYSASQDDGAITECVRALALMGASSSKIIHEETDLRAGLSDAQSLSVNTVGALVCICRLKPRSSVPQRWSALVGVALDLSTRFVESNVWLV